MLNSVQIPKQTTWRSAITEAKYWTLHNFRSKLLNVVQLPKQTTERCTIT